MSDHRRTPGFTSAATAAHMERAANRAVDDPAQLARAARIVRAALARKRLTLDELTPSESDLPRTSRATSTTAA